MYQSLLPETMETLSPAPAPILHNGLLVLPPLNRDCVLCICLAIQHLSKTSLNVVGLYRKCGLSSNVDLLANLISNGTLDQATLDSTPDPHAIAGAIKQCLRSYQPIIPYRYWDTITEHGADVASIQAKIPTLNKALLITLLEHAAKIIDNSEMNKMNIEALSRTLGTNISRASEIEAVPDMLKRCTLFIKLLFLWRDSGNQMGIIGNYNGSFSDFDHKCEEEKRLTFDRTRHILYDGPVVVKSSSIESHSSETDIPTSSRHMDLINLNDTYQAYHEHEGAHTPTEDNPAHHKDSSAARRWRQIRFKSIAIGNLCGEASHEQVVDSDSHECENPTSRRLSTSLQWFKTSKRGEKKNANLISPNLLNKHPSGWEFMWNSFEQDAHLFEGENPLRSRTSSMDRLENQRSAFIRTHTNSAPSSPQSSHSKASSNLPYISRAFSQSRNSFRRNSLYKSFPRKSLDYETNSEITDLPIFEHSKTVIAEFEQGKIEELQNKVECLKKDLDKERRERIFCEMKLKEQENKLLAQDKANKESERKLTELLKMQERLIHSLQVEIQMSHRARNVDLQHSSDYCIHNTDPNFRRHRYTSSDSSGILSNRQLSERFFDRSCYQSSSIKKSPKKFETDVVYSIDESEQSIYSSEFGIETINSDQYFDMTGSIEQGEEEEESTTLIPRGSYGTCKMDRGILYRSQSTQFKNWLNEKRRLKLPVRRVSSCS